MKLRVMPIAATAAVSAALLFGGWYAYGNVATISPLETIAKGLSGVEEAHIQLKGERANVSLQLAPDASLREIVNKLQRDGTKQLSGRELHIDIENPVSDKLEDWWASKLFEIAEAMDTKQFAQIPVKLSAAAEEQGITVRTEMDDRYVYVTLADQQSGEAKFVMLPREPARMEAWSR